MSILQHSNLSVFDNNGLPIEELELERSINVLNSVLESFDSDNLPKYIIEEKAYQERRLQSLRKHRT